MTNQISRIGPTAELDSVNAPDAAAPADTVQEIAFEALLEATPLDAVQDPALHSAIHKIADRIKTGALADPADAVPEVIDAVIEVRFSSVDAATRQQMAGDIRDALSQDPFFVLEVEALIARALVA